jgi:cobalt-zinc-cadmium efflux system membrane fusion protein
MLTKNTSLALAGVVVLGLLMAWQIGGENPAHEAGHDEHGHELGHTARGPAGGRLLENGDFTLDVALVRNSGEPHLRIQAYVGGKLLAPETVMLSVRLERLDATQTLQFQAKKGAFVSIKPVAEPHSFKVFVEAQHEDRRHTWAYEQVEGRVVLDEDARKIAGIGVEIAGPGTIHNVLNLRGEIRIKPNQLARVVPRMVGVATEVRKSLGDSVKKGEVLMVLDSRELAKQKSAFLTAMKRLTLAKTSFQRESHLWQEKITSEQDYLAAENAHEEAIIALQSAKQELLALGIPAKALNRLDWNNGSSLTRYELRAPIDGIIVELDVVTGEAVQAEQNLFAIADLTSVIAAVSVPAHEIGRVSVGQKATVIIIASKHRAEGRVSYVGMVLDEDDRAVTAHISLDNAEQHWRPGQFVQANVIGARTEAPLAVAIDAIQTIHGEPVVFVQFGDRFEIRPVELGLRDEQYVEIRRGLKPGQTYVTRNSFVLKAELGKGEAKHEH